MRDLIFRGGLTAGLVTLMATSAIAQTPPSALSDVPDLRYEGQIGGMDVWAVPGETDLFAVSPDGRTLMRGAIFSGSGRDIGAALIGADPTPLLPKISATSPSLTGRDGVPLQTAAPQTVNTDPKIGFASLLGPDSCQSPILTRGAQVNVPRVTGWDEAGAGNPPPDISADRPDGTPPSQIPLVRTNVDELVDGADIAQEAQNALEGFDETERRGLLLGLVEELRAASSQEEFLMAVASWRARIDQMRDERGLARLYSDDGALTLPPVASATPAPALLAPSPILTSPLPPVDELAAEQAPDQGVSGEEGAPEKSLEQTLLEDARYNALWFSVGANDAPAVYAFVDPTCSYSARAIAALSDQVGSGDLQLRVILAPVLSQRSAGLIAGILTDERPPLAFFDHEVALAERGRSDLSPAELSDLPAQVQAGVQRNFEMIRDYGIPGVPFFVYETGEGARVLSGAPEGIGFPDALSDPYTGIR